MRPSAAQELVAALFEQMTAAEALSHSHDVMRKSYWESHDLPAVRQMAEEAVCQGARRAALLETEAPSAVAVVWTKIKAIHYDLASFTWPGWDEPGIQIHEEDLAAGQFSAQENLRLAVKLGKGELALSRAHWLLGAHQLSAKQIAPALLSFQEACACATRAESVVDLYLNEGYAALAGILLGHDAAEKAFQTAIKQFDAVEEGGEFVKQLGTARAVFCRG